jgi:hypothetical protein
MFAKTSDPRSGPGCTTPSSPKSIAAERRPDGVIDAGVWSIASG